MALVRRDAAGTPVAIQAPLLSAEGAEVRPGTPQPPLSSFLVVPQPGARTVVLRANASGLQAEARYAIGPPTAGVALALEPEQPVKGRDTEAVLTVRLLQPDGTPDDSGSPPVVRANVGRVEELSRTGPGTYRARYVLPTTTYPEVAVLVALSAWPHPQSIHGAYGRILVPLAAAVPLSGEAEPDAQFSITIEGKTYGPTQAGRDGSFQLPVVVPPGQRIGQSRVVDRAGNVRRRSIDLGLPPTDGLACVLNPPRLPADGAARARMLCAASDARGRLVPDARVTAKVRHGTLKGPQRAEGGLLEWIYTAPRGLPAQPESILATWPQKGMNSREELSLQLVQGPAEKVSVNLPEAQVHYGSTVQVSMAVEDAFGRPRPGAQVALGAPVGELSAPREERPGFFQSTWTLPAEGERREISLTGRAFGPVATEPARISAWVRDGELFLGVSNLAGLPIPEQPLSIGGESRVTGADGTMSLGPPRPGKLEVVHGVWSGLRRTIHVLGPSGLVYPVDEPLVPAPVVRAVRLEPAVPVNIRLQVEGARVTYWIEDAQGRVLPDRKVHVVLSSGRMEGSEAREGRTRFTVVGAKPGRVSVSVADVTTGMTAVAEVKP
ncbi:hypothetical protein [Hyalangium rubrum]|uniref:Macroglobulin domain-containing protein n=1 Tax=Hyalangium rubrum TaxID=3103134 RepID=A0ABU5HGJ7_9BACT|nr:hypothetical protein [Hyalangium sp. s54d21]MDY7232583.1 hypothetical protein [Hyalangium sp. s54d21]